MIAASKLEFLPLLVLLIFLVTIATTYSIAVHLDHVKPFFSYLSDIGATPPEMCIFALGCSLEMILIGAVAYIRYLQVEEFFKLKQTTNVERLNKVGLYCGMCAALGTSVVGAFQETSALLVHNFSAGTAFGALSLFFIIQGFLSKKMVPEFGSNALADLRILVGFSCLIWYFVCYVTGVASLIKFTGKNMVKWNADEGGYELHVISVIAEWIMMALMLLYFVSFVPEFRRISLTPPQIQLNLRA